MVEQGFCKAQVASSTLAPGSELSCVGEALLRDSEYPTISSGDMPIQRMDNILIVVDDLEAAKSFFIELGLELEGETEVEGPSVGSLIGLKDVRDRKSVV